MPKRDRISAENRRQFEDWGIKRVRQMISGGHYSDEQRRPMSVWIAEQDSKKARRIVLATTAAVLIILLAAVIGIAGV